MIDAKNVEDTVHLNCRVIGYQFPDDPQDNWCLVRVEVHQGSKTFLKVDPALETTELPDLRAWFSALANDRLPRFSHLTFTEPCLSFEFLAKEAGGVRFAVHLSHELRPNFRLKQFSRSTRDWSMVFCLTPERLSGIVDELDATILKFPDREPED